MKFVIPLLMILLLISSVFSAELTRDEIGDVIPQHLAVQNGKVISPNIDEPFSFSNFFGLFAFFSNQDLATSDCAIYSWSGTSKFDPSVSPVNGGDKTAGAECLNGQFVVPFFADTGNLIFSDIWFKADSTDLLHFNKFYTSSIGVFNYYYGCYNCIQLQQEASTNSCLTKDKTACVTPTNSLCDTRYFIASACSENILRDECSPVGSKDCWGNTLKVCGLKDGYKQLIVVEECDYECIGSECIPEPQECSSTRRCSGDDIQTCYNGEWTTTKTCSDSCLDGVCVNSVIDECSNGETRCSGVLEETCVAGQWSDSGSCETANDVCSVVGDKKCSSGNVEVCTDVSGVKIYKTSEQCEELCANTPSGAECVTSDASSTNSIKQWWDKQSTTNQYLYGGLGLVIILFGLYLVFKPKGSGGL